LGFFAGALLAVAGAWGWWLIYVESVRQPLMNLEVAAGPLPPVELQRQIDKLAAGFLKSRDNVGLVIGVVKDGQQMVFAYGSLARGNAQAPDGETLFELASVGKTFTTAVLADMHLQGELSWHDPLQKLLPAQVRVPEYQGRPITLLDLATHTSGLPSLPPGFFEKSTDPLNPYKDYTVADLYEALPRIELRRAPGTKYEYSNLGMGLLGHALERRAGVPYEQLILERICQPLDMADTRMTLDEALQARLARPHSGGQPVPVWEDRTLPGAGSFLSTADDMLRYLSAHWSDEDAPLHRALHATTRKQRVGRTPWDSLGLGWHIASENAADILWHDGAAGGSTSYVGLIQDRQVAVVVLANSTSSVFDLGNTVLYLLYLH